LIYPVNGPEEAVTMKRVATLFLVLCNTALQAEVTQPECTQLQQWAAKFDPADQWQPTVRHRFPGISSDEVLVPLFGEPITNWSTDDFRNLNQWVGECRRQAADRTAGQNLTNAGQAMLRLSGYVQQIRQIREQAVQAIDTLRAAPESEGRTTALGLAQSALRGNNIRAELRTVPREFQRPLMELSNARPSLPQGDLDDLLARMSGGAGAISAAAATSAPAAQAGASHSLDVPSVEGLTVPLPPLAAGTGVTTTRLAGIHLGMRLDAAIEAGKQAGYRLKWKRGTTYRRGGGEYWLDSVEMEKGEVEPFPGGQMTRAEARAYQTRLAIQAVQSGRISLTGYRGRVGQIGVTGSTFEDLDAVRSHVVDRLGAPHKEENDYPDTKWEMRWFLDQSKQGRHDTQLGVTAQKVHYTDLVRGEDVPYTNISYGAQLCAVLPDCMD
jgi:hypothetical protein